MNNADLAHEQYHKYTAARLAGQVIGGSIGSPIAPQTPHGELLRNAMEENLNRIHTLAGRAEAFADHIAGRSPMGVAAKCTENSLEISGFLVSMREVAAHQRDGLDRISEALGRLEREFGL